MILYKRNDYILKEARWQIEGQLGYRGIGSYDGFQYQHYKNF